MADPTSQEKGAPDGSYALRLTQALEAISAAQAGISPLPDGEVARSAGEGGGAAAGVAATTAPSPPPSPRGRGGFDGLPPIRLPIGPPIPWRLGLPLLAALVLVMGVISRSSAQADAPGVRLPAQEVYPVQKEAPLFTNAQPAATPEPAPAPQALGVQESSPLSIDVVDLTFKLIAVLALAYGSLVLLKRAGFGGATAARSGGTAQGMRVVSSLALAPNRTVHLLKVPGGRTLLLGATSSAVNLLADLGELADAEPPEAESFFDVLKSKLQ